MQKCAFALLIKLDDILRIDTKLEAKTLTEDQFTAINQQVAIFVSNLKAMRQNFKSRRRLIELLDIQGKLVVEDGKRVIYVQANFMTDNERLSIETKST